MSTKELLAAVAAATRGTYLEGCATLVDGVVYFRFDTGDNAVRDNEAEYYNIQADLRGSGFQLDDPCIEHDCISGEVVLCQVEY